MKMVKFCFAFADQVDVLLCFCPSIGGNGAKAKYQNLEWQKQNGKNKISPFLNLNDQTAYRYLLILD
jgi:hypothetical protein